MPRMTQNNRTRSILYGLGILVTAFLAGMIIYKIGSYIAVITFIAVIIGLIVALAYLQHKRPEQKWIFRLIAIGLVVWVGYSWVWPAIYSVWDHKNPQTARGLARKGTETDYRVGDAVDPIGLEARIAAINYCREKEMIEAKEVKEKLDGLIKRRQANNFTKADEILEAQLLVRLSDIADDRRVCQEAIKKMDKKAGLPPVSKDKINTGPSGGVLQDAKKLLKKIGGIDLAKVNWPIRFLIIIGGIILIAFAARFFRGIFGSKLTAVVCIGLIVILLFMALPGLSGKVEGLTSNQPPRKTEARAAEEEPTSGEKLIPLCPDRLSEPIRKKIGFSCCFDTGNIVHSRDIKVYDAATGQYLHTLAEMNGAELIQGVRFSGPTGVLKMNWKKFS